MTVYKTDGSNWYYVDEDDYLYSNGAVAAQMETMRSSFCLFCGDVVMPTDRIFFWQSVSPHPHVTAHAECLALNKDGILADIKKCCGE